jgi:membrane protein DedA with SNARE-associated domain
MTLAEYIILFVLVVILGAGIPGPGDAALIAAGTLAGEGKLKVGILLAVAAAAWMLGSVIGYRIGLRGGRRLLDHPGRFEGRRRKLLVKGDRAFGGHTFVASVTMPAFVSGIFRVRFPVFVLGAVVAGIGWIGMYVGLSYFLGEEVAKRFGDAGAKALLWAIVFVAVGLAVRAGYARWHAARQRDRQEQAVPYPAPLTGDPPLSRARAFQGSGIIQPRKAQAVAGRRPLTAQDGVFARPVPGLCLGPSFGEGGQRDGAEFDDLAVGGAG